MSRFILSPLARRDLDETWEHIATDNIDAADRWVAFWLDPKTLRRAQKILGTATELETIEVALDMIVFRRELLDGTRALSVLQIDSIR